MHVFRDDYAGYLSVLVARVNRVQEAGLILALRRIIKVNLERVLHVVDRDQVGVAIAVHVADSHELHAEIVGIAQAHIGVVET